LFGLSKVCFCGIPIGLTLVALALAGRAAETSRLSNPTVQSGEIL